MGDATPPVLVIGMHRSGTGLVARMLDALGVFVGADLERNHESRYIIGRNEDVLRRAGATWDAPAPVDRLLSDPGRRREAVAGLRRALRFPGWARYAGLRRSVVLTPGRATGPWGWKDPRTTLTAPLWLELFPDARLVHVVRHGVDVAASLVRRNRTEPAPARRRPGPQTPFARGSRMGTLDDGLALWEDYVRRGRAAAAGRGDRAVEVRYEDLLSKPRQVLERLADVADLSPRPAQLATAAALADPDGLFRHRRDAELSSFAAAARDRLEAHGYG